MPFIEANDGVKIHVKDVGKGRPVVLVHGWPLTGDMWEYQSLALLDAGYRVVTYDRRGFGQSGHPFEGYDYDTLQMTSQRCWTNSIFRAQRSSAFRWVAAKSHAISQSHGAKRIAKAVLISSVVPYLLKDEVQSERC